MGKCQNCGGTGIVLIPLPDEMTEEGRVSGGEDYDVCPCCNGDYENCPNCVELPFPPEVEG